MAYAALRSLAQILHQTLNRDHQYLILDEKQQIESLVEKISSIQDFLENSSKTIKQHLERKIRDASYIAEDIIESHITDRIRSESTRYEYGILEKISIRFNIVIEKWIVSSPKPAYSRPSTLVTFDDFMDIKARLVRESSELEIVSMVGMSGIGKTNLAKQVYHDSYVRESSFSFLINLSFPTSLKKLTLVEGGLSLEDMSIVGSLPNLQVLKLRRTPFFRREWITNAGEFFQLKYLLLQSIALKGWRVDPTSFPSLECLVLKDCYDFVEILDEIREIPTLRSIEIYECGV
ncbi:NBS-LRR class resistance protein Fy8-Ry8 [Abeliophyllum distichum]|uniref:NBS-LRR class resistance protein Fy8-Ry8 n=1 Tax=Abeliophyllum distichum TaxID=126358 RepID=A0ABD1PMD7_9LAMI